MATNPPIPDRTHARVLIVDDHPGTAQTLARAVSQLGPEVEALAATRGKEAIDIVNQGAVDILITDLMMPEMTGLQLIESLRAHPAGRPAYIILITAYDVPGLKQAVQRLKLNEMVIKPFRPEKISQMVSKALEEIGRGKPLRRPVEAYPPYKILIADDQPDNIALIARYLQNEGCTYISAANGVEALEKARSEMPDLLLLDVNMPELDGFEVLKQVRLDPVLAHLPVIFLTAARPDPVDVQNGLSLGADDYVTKPFDRRELMARIHTKLRVKEAENQIRRRNREMNVMLEIANLSNSPLSPDQLADEILKRLVFAMDADAGYFFSPAAPLPKSHTRSPRRIETARLTQLAAQFNHVDRPIIMEDVRQQMPWLAEWDQSIQSAAAISVADRVGSPFGTFLLTHSQAGYFALEQSTLMQAVANQIAVAVDRVKRSATSDRGEDHHIKGQESGSPSTG